MDYILLETVGEQTQKAIVMVGRMNPPTIGHYKVISEMKKYIRTHPELKLAAFPVVVIVEGEESSKDTKRNPLTGRERINFMEASGRANGVKFLIAKSGYDAFEEVRKAGLEPLVIAAGSDRAEAYKNMLDKYFKTKVGRPINHHVMKIERDLEVDTTSTLSNSDYDVTKVSGSLARNAVEHGYEDVFAEITGLAEKPDLAKKLFDKVKRAMES